MFAALLTSALSHLHLLGINLVLLTMCPTGLRGLNFITLRASLLFLVIHMFPQRAQRRPHHEVLQGYKAHVFDLYRPLIILLKRRNLCCHMASLFRYLYTFTSPSTISHPTLAFVFDIFYLFTLTYSHSPSYVLFYFSVPFLRNLTFL